MRVPDQRQLWLASAMAKRFNTRGVLLNALRVCLRSWISRSQSSRLMIDAVRSREIFERQMNQRWSPSRHMLEEGGQGFCRFSDSRPLLLTVRGYC